MGTLILLYDNQADVAALSGGAWSSSLPLSNMQDPRPTKKARSTNLTAASTTWRAALAEAMAFIAIVFGPTNMSSGSTYRIRAYSDAAFTTLIDDTGTQMFGATPVDTFDLEWQDANFWSGAQPLEDVGNAAGGIWVIHIYPATVTAQYWQFDLSNPNNPAGFIEVGRLFMGRAYIPSVNYTPVSNKFSFEPFTSMQQAASGAKYFNHRRSGRRFEFAFPVLPQDEVFDDVYTVAAIAGIDRQVFVIPDPDDAGRLSQRSFLGTLAEQPAWSLDNIEAGATGFIVVEAI